jgi:hypothetical protein
VTAGFIFCKSNGTERNYQPLPLQSNHKPMRESFDSQFRRNIHDSKDPQLEIAVEDQQDNILAEMRARIQSIRNLCVGYITSRPACPSIGGKSDGTVSNGFRGGKTYSEKNYG